MFGVQQRQMSWSDITLVTVTQHLFPAQTGNSEQRVGGGG